MNKEINSDSKTLNILNNNFTFNFNERDLKRFKSFKLISIIGMGGSILGTEALNSLLKKIKKKIYFFNNIDTKKLVILKKKNLKRFFS